MYFRSGGVSQVCFLELNVYTLGLTLTNQFLGSILITVDRAALNHSLNFIKSWLQFRYDESEIPGYDVAISHKVQIVFNEAYGYANLEQQTKLTPDHLFRIASHFKTFTATAIMQLQELGK